MKIQKALKATALTMIMLAASGGASALDFTVSEKFFTTVRYNFQPEQELMSFSLQEDNKFARYQSSSLNMKIIQFGAFGTMTDPPPNTDRVDLFAGIKSVVNPGSQVVTAQAGGVYQSIDYDEFRQTVYQPYFSSIRHQFSEQDVAASSRIVLSDATSARILPSYSYGPRYDVAAAQVRGSMKGFVKLEGEYNVVYRADGAFDSFLGWLDNVNYFDVTTEIKRTLRERAEEKFMHATPAERKLFYRNRDGSFGVRGEATFAGMSVHTASPGVLAYTATLPSVLTIDVPVAFTKNNVGAVLDVAFDGQTLASFSGDDYLTDEINLFNIDISSFAGRTGELTFTINTTGPDSAEIFVAERLGGLKVNATSLTPVPEPGTYAMMLAGLTVIAGFVGHRRRKATLH